MPISEKIKSKIGSLNMPDDFKKLMLTILEQEDRGNHRYKEDYIKLVNDYIEKEKGDTND